jgi:hypothetical protein
MSRYGHNSQGNLEAVTSPHKRRKRAKKEEKNVDLADRLRLWGESFGVENDPYLEGLSNALAKGKDLEVWASNDVMALMPEPKIASTEGAVYSALVLLRNVLVFVPVALTWLAVGKATTAFNAYTARSSAASVVNFLQFWQNGYGLLSKTWTLSHVANLDFYIIASVIFLTFITPFMNRSAIKSANRFENDAQRERLALVIEVESFLFQKRQLTPLTMDASLIRSLEKVVKASENLDMASRGMKRGIKTLALAATTQNRAQVSKQAAPPPPTKEEFSLSRDARLQREWIIETLQSERLFEKSESAKIESSTGKLEQISRRLRGISDSLPRKSEVRGNLIQIEAEIEETRTDLELLQMKLVKHQKKLEKQKQWRAAKQEIERNRAPSKVNSSGEPLAKTPEWR